MHVHLWRLVVTLLAVVTLVVSTVAAAPDAVAELDRVVDTGALAEHTESTSDAEDDEEAIPSPAAARLAWVSAACASRHDRPEDIDPSSDRPPPRG